MGRLTSWLVGQIRAVFANPRCLHPLLIALQCHGWALCGTSPASPSFGPPGLSRRTIVGYQTPLSTLRRVSFGRFSQPVPPSDRPACLEDSMVGHLAPAPSPAVMRYRCRVKWRISSRRSSLNTFKVRQVASRARLGLFNMPAGMTYRTNGFTSLSKKHAFEFSTSRDAKLHWFCYKVSKQELFSVISNPFVFPLNFNFCCLQ